METTPIIIDTDAGTDDFMAIAYLLSCAEVCVEAITVVHGLAHVREGARNLRRLLRVAHREDIPVFEGEEKPLRDAREFPAKWRELTDTLPGVRLPVSDLKPPAKGAVEFLRGRFHDRTTPVRILALGPLTNLALALRGVADSTTIRDIVIMGGAVQVRGNLMDGYPEGANEMAEWNIYCDADAAAEVFDSDISTLLVPLDATNHVPIDHAFVEQFTRQDLTPVGQVIADVLITACPLIDTGLYFAWDPLAAVALLDTSIVEMRGANLQVVTEGRNIGLTKLLKWDETSLLKVAINADAAKFQSLYHAAFLTAGKSAKVRKLSE
jgi:purine nucleosidase